jgi:hypothetical protein
VRFSTETNTSYLTVTLKNGMRLSISDSGEKPYIQVIQPGRMVGDDSYVPAGRYEITLPDVEEVAALCDERAADPASYDDFPSCGIAQITAVHLH